MSVQKILDFRLLARKMCKQMELRDERDLTVDPLFVRFYVNLKIIVCNVTSVVW